MESAMFASPRRLLRAAPLLPALARTTLARIAPSTIASIAMEDLRPKKMAYSGIGETSASRIIAQWAAWRRQACEQMLLSTALDPDSDILDLASLQAVSSMLEASFLRARAVAEDDDDVRRARKGDREAHVEQRVTRDQPRLRGRQTRRNVVTRELQSLSELRAVSNFAHRSRLESFLRGRFFRDGEPMHDDGSVSIPTGELGQLRESHAVPGLREEVRFTTQNITHDQATNPSGSMCAENSTANNEHHSSTDQVFRDDDHQLENATGNHEIQMFQSREEQSVNVEIDDPLQDDIDQEHVHGQGYQEYPGSSSSPSDNSVQSGSSSASPCDNSVPKEAGTDGQPNEGEDGALVDRGDEGHVINSQEVAEPRRQPDESFYRPTSNNRFGHPADAVYGVELPELLNRRNVSNLLSSGFRESLDQQLTQSYARRQELIHSYNQIFNQDNAERGNNEPNQAGHDAAARPWIVFSGEGYRPRQWYWSRPEFVLDAIEDLEQDMAVLYLGMTSMQEMMRGCMQMQIELQRSIKQEVSAALNRPIRVQWWAEGQRYDTSRWQLVRKGTCCVCCDKQIDSVLYRCGHMCACSKCATELLNGVGKCPMCRAPIVEVVRVYTA